jgi:hypothetical protein
VAALADNFACLWSRLMARTDPRPHYGSKRRESVTGYIDIFDPKHPLARADGYVAWLALTPFDSLDEALTAAERVLPLIAKAWTATLDKSSASQAYYREAMAATAGMGV